ncbi:MAG: hypothetical protein RIF41_08575 [Polyangiaceae bacterium]
MAEGHPSSGGRRRLLLSGLALSFIGAQLALGVRGCVVGDNRYGWGMFGDDVHYRVRYAYVRADGSRTAFRPDLRGKAKNFVGGPKRTRYGVGSLRTAIPVLLRHEYERRPSPDVVACEATLDYQVNHIGEREREVLSYPPRGAK